jgi:hypothetical protein
MDLTNTSTGNYIYKFLPINHFSLGLLINKKLWLGAPNILNDPFEGDLIISNLEEIRTKECCSFLVNELRSGKYYCIYHNRIEKLLENEEDFSSLCYEYLGSLISRTFGSTSFSKSCDSINMWSHYADSHKGFVIVFDRLKLNNSIASQNVKILDVNYSGLPNVELSYNNKTLELASKQRILISKLPEWEQENEVRIIRHDDYDLVGYNRYLRFDEESVIGILHGERIELVNRLTIDNIIAGWSENDKERVKFYKTLKNELRNKLIFEQIPGSRTSNFSNTCGKNTD